MSVCHALIEGATIDRFGFDVELLYLAHRAGLRLREIPVRWDHNEGSKVNIMNDSFKMLSEVGLIRRQARRGVYDKAIQATLFALSLTVDAPGLLQLYNPFFTSLLSLRQYRSQWRYCAPARRAPDRVPSRARLLTCRADGINVHLRAIPAHSA